MTEQIISLFLSNPWLLPLLILGVLFKFFAPMIKGKIGEGTVNLAATLGLNSDT